MALTVLVELFPVDYSKVVPCFGFVLWKAGVECHVDQDMVGVGASGPWAGVAFDEEVG